MTETNAFSSNRGSEQTVASRTCAHTVLACTGSKICMVTNHKQPAYANDLENADLVRLVHMYGSVFENSVHHCSLTVCQPFQNAFLRRDLQLTKQCTHYIQRTDDRASGSCLNEESNKTSQFHSHACRLL